MNDQEIEEEEKPEELIFAERLIVENKYTEALQVLTELVKKKSLPLNHKVSCLCLQARLFMWIGKLEFSIKISKQAYEESLSLGKNFQTLDALNLMALVYYFQGMFDKAREIIIKLEKLFQTFTKESSAEYIRREAHLNFIKGNLTSEDDVDRGLEYLEYSLSLWDKIEPRIEKAMTIMCIGWILNTSKGELEQSINYLEQALAIAEEINHKYGIAFIHLNLGSSYRFKGELNISLKHYENSLNLFKEINNRHHVVMLYNRIGNLLREKGEVEQALKNIEKSIAISKEIGSFFVMFSALISAVEIYLENGDRDKAYKYFHDCKKLSGQIKNPDLELWLVFLEAILLKKSQRIRDKAKAEELLKEVLEKSDIDFELTIKTLFHLCDLFLTELHTTNNLEVLDEINPLINRLLEIARNSHSYWILCKTYILQARLALVTLDLKEARSFLTEAQLLAEKYGLNQLAIKISNEHDELLKQLEIWENLEKNEVSLNERMELAGINEQMKNMIYKHASIPVKVEAEQPIVLIIMTGDGNPILINHFTVDMVIDDDRLGEFLSSYNIYCNQIFSKTFDRMKLGQYTVLINAVNGFSICYLFQGKTYSAQQKVKFFSEALIKDIQIIEVLKSANNKGKMIEVSDNPHIEELIVKSFMSDLRLFRTPFKAYIGNEPFVFVSYIHVDKLEVYPIIDYLNKMKIKIWYDEGIPVSENWKRSIAINLERCKAFLVFISPQIINSEYVKKEISFAIKKEKPFFAVYLKETKLPAELEFEMVDIQAMMKYLIPKTEFYTNLKELLSGSLND
jgi:tetratricopeptide (TPR) repeat protein